MKLGQSSNPALNRKMFDNIFAGEQSEPMTINGALNKTILLALLVFLSASIVWRWLTTNPAAIGAAMPVILVGAIGGLIMALVTTFKKEWAGYTSPIYALLEGLFLGGITVIFETMVPGIALQAIGLTFGVLFLVLFLYRTGIVRATEKFKMGVIAATGGIFVFYMVSMVANMFGANISVFNMGWIGLGIQLLIVVVAAMNLVLDFDFIEEGANAGAPKYIEWYAAFGLMVTIVWLYIEILKLLAILARRD